MKHVAGLLFVAFLGSIGLISAGVVRVKRVRTFEIPIAEAVKGIPDSTVSINVEYSVNTKGVNSEDLNHLILGVEGGIREFVYDEVKSSGLHFKESDEYIRGVLEEKISNTDASVLESIIAFCDFPLDTVSILESVSLSVVGE